MPCNKTDCCSSQSLFSKFPDKFEELNAYMNALELTDDIEFNRGFLIQCLHKAQHIFGYLPEELQLYIAKKLKLYLADVNGVITFYSFFTITPPGKYKVNVCTGTACFVKGADKVMKEFEDQLGIKDGSTRDDLKFSLGGLRCVGACSLAPVVMVNDKVYGKVTDKMVKDIISDCK